MASGAVTSSTRGKENYYRSTKRVRIPALSDAGSSLGVGNQVPGQLLDPEISKDEILTVLQLWGEPRIKTAELIYYPLWLYTLKDSSERLVLIDGITGKPSDKIEHFKHIFEKIA